jgi:hypothetical protein
MFTPTALDLEELVGLMKHKTLIVLAVCLLFLLAKDPACRSQTNRQLNVQIVTDEADAVLAILAKRKAAQPVSDSDWQHLFASEGNVSLKKRELSFKRPFDDAQFKLFVLSDQLATRAASLSATLEGWQHADLNGAARKSLAYLPAGAQITAKIYPVIKPQPNSFVFEASSDPAIFLYHNPEVTKDQFENTLAHELHHIGYSGSCGSGKTNSESKPPQNLQDVIEWISAFGEGFAMLAAAGGPDNHPHQFSKPEDRARWDRDMANFNSDLKKVEGFFTDILGNKLTKERQQEAGYAFFGVQGPWYTVGWKMAVVIEKTYGRAKLIECLCDHRKLLSTYNRAATEFNRTAREPLALWSPAVLDTISGSSP